MAQQRGRKNKKIIRYKRRSQFDIGFLIFFVVLVYMGFYGIKYFQSEKIVMYEVKQGSLAKNNTYTGVILRSETVTNAEKNGYINYYAKEGDKVGVGNTVYAIDESGKLSELLEENSEALDPSADEMKELREEVMNFTNQFSTDCFDDIYHFKSSLEKSVLKITTTNLSASVDILSSEYANLFSKGMAKEAGIVVYYTDGYEGLTRENVTKDILEEKKFEKTYINDNELVESGNPVYKTMLGETWSVVVSLEEERFEELQDKTTVPVRIKKDGEEMNAAITLFRQNDGLFAELTFTNGMIRYASERFVEVELLLEEEQGLKIPVSAVADVEFYLIPKEYASVSEDKTGFNKVAYREDDGSRQITFVETEIYQETDTDYYVSMDAFEPGDRLAGDDTMEEYTISRKGTLTGVYNVNKGYADFSQITILYQNKEYCIIQPNTKYGLTVYDYIILDANTVKDKEILYN